MPLLQSIGWWRQSLARCLKLEGDVCHQAPGSSTCRAIYYSDLAPVLLAYDARAEVFESGKLKTIHLTELIHEHIQCKDDPRILTGVLIPHPAPGTVGKFFKKGEGRRAAFDFAVINGAVCRSPIKGEKGRALFRIFVGASGADRSLWRRPPLSFPPLLSMTHRSMHRSEKRPSKSCGAEVP